jgi:DNA-directed RNA polymerase specialized sigma24 family protein
MNASLSDAPITLWMERLQSGDPDAAEVIWNQYFSKLVAVARSRLHSTSRAAGDEEDVALSAFKSFYCGIEAGRFPDLADRDGIWKLLLVITARKASRLNKRERTEKRGGGKVIQASALDNPADSHGDFLGAVEGNEPSPAFTAEVVEEYLRLFSILGEGELQQVAIYKMEGFTNVEIAARIGRSEVTVGRKLGLIRKKWVQEPLE